MRVIESVEEIRKIVEEEKARGKIVGLVPTMGFFHQGHLELMKKAREECDVVVVSLFVNPTQFGPGEDYADYPRDFSRDSSLAQKEGVDYLFHPSVEEMYPPHFSTHVEVEGLSRIMCGVQRPTHFRGVTTVVAKLFNIIPAQVAYFGQKDAQQLAVVRRMARDLNFPIEVRAVPTLREEDGLAMSSRNAYLAPNERKAAAFLFKALKEAERLIESGERSAEVIKRSMESVIGQESLVNLEYIEICGNINLEPLQDLSGEVLVAIACRVGKARLIDNLVFHL
ncbi:MAG: pantoate--beta-alanine ligase [Actinomycetota bacterium]|nr:pantoate--beta-alanine ligase [Actinomycetota bacterium]